MRSTEMTSNQTLLAFDYGLKRIGVAVGQTITCTAQPLVTLKCNNGTPDWLAIEKLHKQWQPAAYVIGLPLNKDGSDSNFSKAVRHFASNIEERFQQPVHLQDERLSSSAAESFLNSQREDGSRKQRVQKEDIDRIAAAVIIQSWLNENS